MLFRSKNILKYLRRTKDLILVYGGEEHLAVTGTAMLVSKPTRMTVDHRQGMCTCLMVELYVGRVPSRTILLNLPLKLSTWLLARQAIYDCGLDSSLTVLMCFPRL